MKIVRSNSVARALREEINKDHEQQSLSIAFRFAEDAPSLLRGSFFEGIGLLDLNRSCFNEVIVGAAVSVVLWADFLVSQNTGLPKGYTNLHEDL